MNTVYDAKRKELIYLSGEWMDANGFFIVQEQIEDFVYIYKRSKKDGRLEQLKVERKFNPKVRGLTSSYMVLETNYRTDYQLEVYDLTNFDHPVFTTQKTNIMMASDKYKLIKEEGRITVENFKTGVKHYLRFDKSMTIGDVMADDDYLHLRLKNKEKNTLYVVPLDFTMQ